MDVMMDAAFWGEVGLAAASKLALIAAGLWGMKMVADHRQTVSERGPLPAGDVPEPAAARPVSGGVSPARVHGPRRLRLVRAAGEQPEAAAPAPPPPVRTAADRERMRARLMEYLEQHKAGGQTR